MIHRTNILKVIIAIILSMYGMACDDDIKIEELDFIGDSLVDGWNVGKCFPSHITTNYGVSGATIDYIESMAGKFTNRTVIVLVGTNDKYQMTETTRPDYVKRYIEAIIKLNGRKLYLFSVLPRDYQDDTRDFNEDIRQFNLMVQDKIKSIPNIEYIDVYNEFLDNGKLIHKYFKDGLHLNNEGYKLITAHLSTRLSPL